MALKDSQRSLRRWTKQKWTTASGKKSSETGEVYAPKKTLLVASTFSFIFLCKKLGFSSRPLPGFTTLGTSFNLLKKPLTHSRFRIVTSFIYC